MPSLSEITGLSPKVLQKKLKLEPRQRFGKKDPDNLVFMSPSVALKDEELRHGGKDEIGAKECLSRVTRKILETKDASLFEVHEITATHLGYGRKPGSKEGQPAITKEEGEYWLSMLDFTGSRGNLSPSGDIDLSPEYIKENLSGLKVEEKGRFHLFFSVLLIYYDKRIKTHEDERKATVGPNKISDFLIFWTLPYLLNFSHRKVQEILQHRREESGDDFTVPTVEVTAEDIIESAGTEVDDHCQYLLKVFEAILRGSRPLKNKYKVLADSEQHPIIFVPMEYQVTKMPVHMQDIGSKETWDKLFDAKLVSQFIDIFVKDFDIQRDFFSALYGLEGRQGIDYGIVLPDKETYEDFLQVIKDGCPDAFIEPLRSNHCQGIRAERALVKGSQTNYTVCFSYLPGTRNNEIAQLFRAIGSHYRNHFTIIILHGHICNTLDVYQCGNLHPVSAAMKFIRKKNIVRRVTKVRKRKTEKLHYPLNCLDQGRGAFTQADFPITYLKWEEEVKTDPNVSKKKLSPQYDYDSPIGVGFFKKGLSKEAKALPLPGPCTATSKEQLLKYPYRVVNFDGCAIEHIARSARKYGFAMIMALSGYCDKVKSSFSSKPEIMRIIICHFVRAIMVAGLPSVFLTVSADEDHEVQEGSESDDESEEGELDEDSEDASTDDGCQSEATPQDQLLSMLSEKSENDPGREPTLSDLDDIAAKITGFWKRLGRKLGVDQAKIDTITYDNVIYSDIREKAFQMLKAWYDAGQATYGKLVEGFQAIRN